MVESRRNSSPCMQQYNIHAVAQQHAPAVNFDNSTARRRKKKKALSHHVSFAMHIFCIWITCCAQYIFISLSLSLSLCRAVIVVALSLTCRLIYTTTCNAPHLDLVCMISSRRTREPAAKNASI